jgi:hypothetical protein
MQQQDDELGGMVTQQSFENIMETWNELFNLP